MEQGKKYIIEDIESCEQIGEFSNEFVYDIEVDDESHTFIVNDILVHNSSYVTFKPVMDSCGFVPSEKVDGVAFILKIKEYRLDGMLDEKFDEYAKKFNTENLQVLELEKISHSVMMIAKKKYILDLAWKDPGMRFPPQTKIKCVGIEIAQGSTPKFAKKVLNELIIQLLREQKTIRYVDLVRKLKEYKKDFIMQSPEDISKVMSLGDYEKFVLDDKNSVKLASKCPYHVRGGANYNYQLNNSKWKGKYRHIRTSDKVKFYATSAECEVFAYLPGDLPYEFAPPINYDAQFAKVIVEPFNRYIKTMGFQEIPSNLIYAKNLF
jgi:hypothetical protein